MPRNTSRYIVLALLLAAACARQTQLTWFVIEGIWHGEKLPSDPVSIQMVSRKIGAGPLRGDRITAINGKPFRAYGQLVRIIETADPGDPLRLGLTDPAGAKLEKILTIRSQREDNFNGFVNDTLHVILTVFIPILAIGLGFGVAAIRPRDPNAWLLLFLLLGFSATAAPNNRYGPWPSLTIAWDSVCTGSWPISMLLFAIHFPTRVPFDRRMPWLKLLVAIPIAVVGAMYFGLIILWFQDIDTAAVWRPLFVRLYATHQVTAMMGIGGFFACLGYRTHLEPTADGRRRLRLLQTGATISLTPMLIAILYSLFRDRDLFNGVPWPLTVTALLFLALFPVTLAYVIVVQRAMNLSFVVRRSLQYGLARGVLYAGRGALIALAVYFFKSAQGGRTLELGTVGVGFLVLRRQATNRASQWVDRKFFREAYSAEKVLSELAAEVARYVEIQPLLEKVGTRISETLHVPDLVVLMRDGDKFVTRFSTLSGKPMALAADSRLIVDAAEQHTAIEVYGREESATLGAMNTQLVLPLFAQGQLTGIVCMGPKLSEVPYSQTDIQLLQTIASQMGLALENSRLVISLAAEAVHRERANTELNIAREVQERLFPQNFPAVRGLDCAGYCRPARGVGGDYYDFLELEGGSIGIAIGDVSGKGIAAALLMASLQASLRGQTMAGVHDLSALMKNVNKLVYDASTSNRYATFFYGEYNPESRRLNFVNAGHNPPVILRGADVVRLEAGGPVVGLLPFAEYDQAECVLHPGDIFIGFTDGISEAMNEQDEEWEEERFIEAAHGCRGLAAKGMIESIFAGADGFAGAANQYDDMTLLVMKLI